MKRSLLLIFFLFGCATDLSVKEFAYKGEALTEIGPHGLLVGHAMVPLDTFPHNQRSTIVMIEDTKTKKIYQYGKTKGVFFMKLPPGEYTLKDLSVGETCNTSTGLMISNFFVELPDSLGHLRGQFEKVATEPLLFTIQKGKMTDIGNLLMTCFDWDARPKFEDEFTQYIEDGKFEIFKPMTYHAQDCGCKILRKWDERAQTEMNKALK